MAAGDGSRLNLAATLAGVAADLQKSISSRARSHDPVVGAALVHVRAAVGSLAAAVRELAAEIEEGDGGG